MVAQWISTITFAAYPPMSPGVLIPAFAFHRSAYRRVEASVAARQDHSPNEMFRAGFSVLRLSFAYPAAWPVSAERSKCRYHVFIQMPARINQVLSSHTRGQNTGLLAVHAHPFIDLRKDRCKCHPPFIRCRQMRMWPLRLLPGKPTLEMLTDVFDSHCRIRIMPLLVTCAVCHSTLHPASRVFHQNPKILPCPLGSSPFVFCSVVFRYGEKIARQSPSP